MAKKDDYKRLPLGDEDPVATDEEGRFSVLVELRGQTGASPSFAMSQAETIEVPGFDIDREFEPVPILSEEGAGMSSTPSSFVVRGTCKEPGEMDRIREHPSVVDCWPDTPIAPFGAASPAKTESSSDPALAPMGTCPIGTCDCSPGVPKGSIADVATYLGADKIWAQGYKGAGIVVGVVDGGITAQGRPVLPGETTNRISRVIGGWPTASWGTQTGQWNGHGNMSATDVLGMAPEAQIFDMRIAGPGGSPGTISRALQAYQWAIAQHKLTGKPQVLSNSWGIYKESWDPFYATNPNHPFTKKVVEAIHEGILVLFAAGNCGGTCPDGRCGPDNGPGKSIWGANGHAQVMTVGAANRNEQLIGYSSQGPAALSSQKPDFLGISHFTGYFTSDNGTSAACPVMAGISALIKQAKPAIAQAEVKASFEKTAKDIGPSGWDPHSGHGIAQGKAAFDDATMIRIERPRVAWDEWFDGIIRRLLRIYGLRERMLLDVSPQSVAVQDGREPNMSQQAAPPRVEPDYVLTPQSSRDGRGYETSAVRAEIEALIAMLEEADAHLRERAGNYETATTDRRGPLSRV